MENEAIFIILGQALFAILGAVAKWLNLKDSERQRTIFAEAATAMFSGGLVYCVYGWLHLNVYLAFALSGMVGWLGALGIDMLGKMIAANSGLKELQKDEESNPQP